MNIKDYNNVINRINPSGKCREKSLNVKAVSSSTQGIQEYEYSVQGVERVKKINISHFSALAATLVIIGCGVGFGVYGIKNMHSTNPLNEEAESVQEFKALQLHEPAQYADSLKEAEDLIDEHSIMMQWDERHNYRVDTAYYTELLQSESYDINSLEAKSYIYHIMCNSYLYFDTAKGAVSNRFEGGSATTEFQVNFVSQECYSKTSSKFDNGGLNSDEYYFYDDKMFDVFPDSMIYRLYGSETYTEMKLPEDNYRYVVIAPPDYSLNYQPANSIMFAGGIARQLIIPEGFADYWLNDFDKWQIDDISERLGRKVAELSGVNNNGNDFKIVVDINTGIMVEHTEIINGTANTNEITSLEVDIPIERIEFDPSGYTKENLYDSSEIR